ncbi:ATP-binding cassette domain-containing protein [Myroides sp. BIT-d1]|uniref:ATP-binding cassette domain-containing protein n=1 Tax=Myroides albus TaxID=2562892 RepID=A0A6I3LKL3_9FLAO|nr:ABC-F family ATP-binding cassette domain-containing protein [Myroides albus]MTG98863.1 ATP-binding cassette domain-containing protein [Myroides albus]
MVLSISNLSYSHSDYSPLFSDLNFVLNRADKISLIGDNGTGKSTLLKLISSEIAPQQGTIELTCSLFYLKQNKIDLHHQTIAEALGIDVKLNALKAILSGSSSAEHYDLLDDDWGIEERVEQALNYWDLAEVDLTSSLATLSGGQQTKVQFARMMLSQAELLLLDEPTNHIDIATKLKLYNYIENFKGAIIIVSHDRALLNQVHLTYELVNGTLERYGGNFSFFKQQKELKLAAMNRQVEQTQKELKEVAREKQKQVEKQTKEKAKNKRNEKSAGLPKIVINAFKNKAENSAAKSLDVQQRRADQIKGNLSELQSQLHKESLFDIRFPQSRISKGKLLWRACDLQFTYDQTNVFLEPLSFDIVAGERTKIVGDNGSGKSTLFKLLVRELFPSSGELEHSQSQPVVVYLDQHYGLLTSELTLQEQIAFYNKLNKPSVEVNNLLFQYGLHLELWQRKVALLSGGEKLKLALCCLTLAYENIDVLLLDEPTNNLDIKSTESLTAALNQFNGTILVISHDTVFLQDMHTDKEINLNK